MTNDEIEQMLHDAGAHVVAEAFGQLMRKSAAWHAKQRKIKEEAEEMREKLRVHFVSGPDTLQ
jgi:hypothetical protein